MEDAIKFKIDKRYIRMLIVKYTAGYLLALALILLLLKPEDTWGFIGTTFVVAVGLFFYGMPRVILVKDGVVSFTREYSYNRIEIPIGALARIETSSNRYNTVTLYTKSGLKYQLHPAEAEALAALLRKTNSRS